QTDYLAAVGSGDLFLEDAASARLSELGVEPAQESSPSSSAYIRSPVAGRIGEVFLNSGAWLTRGSVFASVIENGGRELRIDVPEGMAYRVGIGMLVSADINGRRWYGTVNRIESLLGVNSQTLPVYATLPDTLQSAAGTALIAEINFPGSDNPIIAVPAASVLTLGERSVVYVDLGDSRYIPRAVRTGELSFNESYEPVLPVYDGLSVGEKVVLDGAFLLDSQAELTGITSLMNYPAEEDL
ncbi:MAG: HlyD family efflux transporter periplasmic adaptor subunit, partial [bacterium]|nr:HlyD family efflux transporter periplasmic adaptor subunit [bacterium]